MILGFRGNHNEEELRSLTVLPAREERKVPFRHQPIRSTMRRGPGINGSTPLMLSPNPQGKGDAFSQ
ncbi:hypothetical protein GE061_001548 [Apolygus lucorum]|uniref:Uncharacterized protein n=1 Tax=Apolygus lucorum TaxID=248454 RepID=A0A8S9Y915_APOLU|nr:hypothetical protein GE061_001548 [Apolygus lucorum]